MTARAAARPRVPRRKIRLTRRARVWRRRAVLVIAVTGLLAALYMLWLRHSSFVAVKDVHVSGVTSQNRDQVTAALDRAGRGMSTLDPDVGRLDDAVRQFPTVASVSADPSFPNGLEIHVTERRSAAVIGSESRAVPVAADGTVLDGLGKPSSDLPAIPGTAPNSGRLTGVKRQEAIVLGAAPAPLRPEIASAASGNEGIKARLTGGIEIVFGDSSRADAKWAAAARVLADPGLTSVGYVDVRAPERPAAGGAVRTPE